MKIKNKKKFIRGILILIAIISLFASQTTYSYIKNEYKEIKVSAGETLWEIAEFEQKNNEYYKGKEVREIIENIKRINNLEISNLYEGQKLLITIK